MEIHALIHREVHFVLTVGQHQAAMGINVLNKARNGVDVDGVRQVAGESHDNRDIGMVAFTGQGEGAVDVDDDFAHLGQQAARDQVVSELFARFHRSNGMGAGRANADFKDIEYADHMYSRAVGKRAAVKRRGALNELAEQRVEDRGDGNQAHNHHEDVADMAAVFTHRRDFLNRVHRHQEQDHRDNRAAKGLDHTEDARVQGCHNPW